MLGVSDSLVSSWEAKIRSNSTTGNASKPDNRRKLTEPVALKRRKAIYLAIHPETKKGAVGRRGSGKGETVSESDNLSFTDDAASKTGVSSRTVRRCTRRRNREHKGVGVVGREHGRRLKRTMCRFQKTPPPRQAFPLVPSGVKSAEGDLPGDTPGDETGWRPEKQCGKIKTTKCRFGRLH